MNVSKNNSQRSLHYNSVKYSNSIIIGPKIKQKPSKKAKVKKGNFLVRSITIK